MSPRENLERKLPGPFDGPDVRKEIVIEAARRRYGAARHVKVSGYASDEMYSAFDTGVCMSRKLLAEFLGTAVLVFFGVGVATLSFGFGADGASFAAGVVATALAFGLTLMALAYALGPVSGCHVNPAVTIGALVAGRISLSGAVGYWIAQFLGGIVGALGLWGVFSSSPLYGRTTTGLGTDGWGAASHIHIGVGGAFATEAILTALFVFVILSVTSKSAHVATAAMVIGLTLTAVHLVGIPITGTSVNPARALGPALIVGGTAIHQVWLFIVAPLVGGVLAALIYRVFHPANGDPAN